MKLKDILTKRGTKIKRYRNIVGKQVGSRLYVHRNYANEVIPNNILKIAANKLKEIYPTFKFNSIMWDKTANIIRFDESPDFDTAREPHVGKYIAIFPNGNFREGYSNNIWHHKWLWVKDNYRGFNVEESKKWSEWWISKLQGIAKGTDTSFDAQLKQIKMPKPQNEQLIMESEPDNSDEWDNWMEYLDYFDYDIDKNEVVKLIKKHGLDGRKYLGGRIIKLWDRKQECYLEHDKNDGTVSLIKNIEQWIYDNGDDVIDIDSSEIYNSWVESSLKDLKENPGNVYHYTTEEKWNEIQRSGQMIGSAGTGLTNRGEYGIFTSTDPEEHASGTYGNVCLELNLEQFKNDSGLKALDLSFEPDVMEYLIRDYVRSQLELEGSHDDIDSSGGMSPYTVIVSHNIPIKYIRLI